MKTIIFLALLSLSFAFIPKSLYKENLTVSDVMTENASDFVKDTNSSDSSDYLVIEIYPDYSDWNNATNSTDSSDYLAVEIYPSDNDWNNTSFYNRSNLTGSADYHVQEIYTSDSDWNNITNSSDSSDYLFIEIYFIDSDWNNITNSTNSSNDLVDDWNNNTFYDRDNLTVADMIMMDNSTKNMSSSNSSDYWDNATFYERYNLIIADVIAGIALDAAKNMNSSNSSNYTVMETHFDESNWTNITNSSDFSDFPVIEIGTDDSDWINIKPEIIELFKPIFMNFTEAYYQYLSENNSEVSLEDQLLYDDILTSIAQLFNETVEEKALFGNVTEKDDIIERNNTENQDGKNFMGSQ